MHWPFSSRRNDEYSFVPKTKDNKHFKTGIAHELGDCTDEDCCTFKFPFLNEENSGFFGLFEGHRQGWTAARAVSLHLHEILENEILAKQNLGDMRLCLESSFAKMDDMMSSVFLDRGTSATVCILREMKFLHVANVGETRAILCRGTKAIRLTQDHTRSDEKEKTRLANCIAYTESSRRIQGLIRQTRAFGDHLLKDWIINTPHYLETRLESDDTHVIFLSSSVAAVIEDQDAVNLVLGIYPAFPPRDEGRI